MEMNQDAQLSRFSKMIEKEIRDLVKEINENAVNNKNTLMEDAEKRAKHKAQEMTAQKQTDLQVELRERNAKIEQDLQNQFLLRRNELIQELFSSLRDRLEQYVQTEDYLTELKKKCVSVAKNGPCIFQVTKRDFERLSKDEAPSGCQWMISDSIYIGGVVAEALDHKTCIDFSFDSALETERREFSKRYSLSIDKEA